jgi:hypothetical protein
MGQCKHTNKKKSANRLKKLRKSMKKYSSLLKERGHDITSDCHHAQRVSGSVFMIAVIDWVEMLREGEALTHKSVCPTWNVAQSVTWREEQWAEKKMMNTAETIRESRLMVCGWRQYVLLERGPNNQDFKYWENKKKPCQRSFCYLSDEGLQLIRELVKMKMRPKQRLRRECFEGGAKQKRVMSSAIMEMRAKTKMCNGEELQDKVKTDMTVVLTKKLKDVPLARQWGKTGGFLSTEKRKPQQKRGSGKVQKKRASGKVQKKRAAGKAQKKSDSGKAEKETISRKNSDSKWKWTPRCTLDTCQKLMVWVAFQVDYRECDECDRQLKAGNAWECVHKSSDSRDLCLGCAEQQRNRLPPLEQI